MAADRIYRPCMFQIGIKANINPYDGFDTFHDLIKLAVIHWSSGDWKNWNALRHGFESHNAHVRAIVLGDNLLEFRPSDGCEPLDKYLDKPIPNEPFPRVNEGGNAANLVKNGVIVRLAQLAALPVEIVISAALAW